MGEKKRRRSTRTGEHGGRGGRPAFASHFALPRGRIAAKKVETREGFGGQHAVNNGAGGRDVNKTLHTIRRVYKGGPTHLQVDEVVAAVDGHVGEAPAPGGEVVVCMGGYGLRGGVSTCSSN